MRQTLDLGCGDTPKNPFGADVVYGVDLVDFGKDNIAVADLAINKIPFKDNTFDYVTATDFLEHIPRVLYLPGFMGMTVRKSPFIDLMSDIWRVLTPGGKFFANTPAVPHPEAFQDPTHVNFITENTVNYFLDNENLGQIYGFKGNFKLLEQSWSVSVPFHLTWYLEAVK